MLTIRLQRTGTKNKPSFRLVLAEKEKAAGKKFLEVLGHYNPRLKQFGVKDESRLKYWIGQHVDLSPTVHNLLVEKKLVDAQKVKAWKPKKSASAESSGGSAQNEVNQSGGKEGVEAPAAAAAPAEPVAEAPKTEDSPAPETTA